MQAPRRVSAGARTNVPVWPDIAPEFDANAAAAVVITIEVDVPSGWPTSDVRRLSVWQPGDHTFADVASDVAATHRVGVRVGVAGPEADVLLLRALLLDAGFVERELHLHATASDEIRVRCVHCGGVSRVRARPGGTGACPTCAYELDVHPHFSPRHAVYLGVRADAEHPR